MYLRNKKRKFILREHQASISSTVGCAQERHTHYNEIMEMFKKVQINLPLLDAIKQIP